MRQVYSEKFRSSRFRISDLSVDLLWVFGMNNADK